MKYILALLSLLFTVSGCREEVIHLSNEIEANQVILTLREGNVDATKKFNTKEWIIEVPKNNLTKALRIMADSKIPKKIKIKNNEENNQSIFSSKREKDSTRDRALSSELSEILEQIPNVIEAKITIFNVDSDPLSLSPKNERSASILVLTGKNSDLDRESIKDLVSKGAGIAIDKISFILASNKNEVISNQLTNEIVIEEKQEEKIENNLFKIFKFNKYILSSILACLTLVFLIFKMRKNSHKLRINKALHEVTNI